VPLPTNPPPTIALTSPANGASYTAPATINLAASVTANSHAITQVQFYNGATLLGSAASAPYVFSWTSIGAGAYSLTATVVYDAGSTVTSTAVTVTVNTGARPGTALVAAYGFEEGSGTTVTDSSGNGNNGTISGATSWTGGEFGGALSFDGASSVVTVADSASLDLSSGMTLEAWVYPLSVNRWNPIVLKSGSGLDCYIFQASSAATTPAVYCDGFGANVDGPSALPANAWSHLATTYDGTNAIIYVNGVQVASVAHNTPITVSPGNLTIGFAPPSYFLGKIDELRVYNYALTAGQIQADMNTPVVGADTNLPPSVALTVPANGASFAAPATISLAASVTPNGHTITQVQFYNGSNLLGSAATAPYGFTWNSVPAGNYSLSAVVVYDSGSSVASIVANVSVTANPPPTVALTAPANGANYTAPATINLAASVTPNGHTIAQVQFYSGSTLLGSAAAAPYAFTWNSVAAGSYNLTAVVVYDGSSTVTSTAANVTVVNPPPTVALTSPASGANYTAPATINLAASVAPNGHAITQVNFYNGASLLGSAAIAPYAFAWSSVPAGSYSLSATVVYDSGSTVSSPAANVTVVNPPPTVALTAPLSGASYLAPASINLAAAVTANGHTITQVQFFNGVTLLGSANSAPYTFTWSAVGAGNYSLSAHALYDSGSVVNSTAAGVTVTNPPPPAPPVLINVSGAGSISPNPQNLTIGASYTVTAIPGPGQQFSTWKGSVNSTNPTITFIVTADFQLTAIFVPSPYTLTSGTFNGLILETNDVQTATAGAFTIQVTSRGTYSARVQMGVSRFSFSGKIDTNGLASYSLLRRANSPLQVQMRLGAGNQANQVFGTLSDGTWAAALSGDRAVFNARTNPAPYAGSYTVVFLGQPGQSSLPAGNGFGTVRVNSSGLLFFSGELADGTRVSQSATISADGLWPLYVPLYSGTGLLISWMDFTNETDADLSGLTSWIKPGNVRSRYYAAGFTNQFQALGSAYVAPRNSVKNILGLPEAVVTFSGGDLQQSFANQLALSLLNRVTDLSSNRLSLNFSLSTGTFSGTVAEPNTTKPLQFSGAVFQKTGSGYGLFLGADQSTTVTIAPPAVGP